MRKFETEVYSNFLRKYCIEYFIAARNYFKTVYKLLSKANCNISINKTISFSIGVFYF